MAKRPTQADIAKLAGVSRATVSYVLNNRSGGNISITEQTKQKVFQTARELGYEPNALAQSLKTGVSNTVGILMPAFHNPHYWDILEGVEDEVVKNGYHLTIATANLEPERERRCLQTLFQQRLDGLILLPTFLDRFPDEVEFLSERTSPAVFVTKVEGADWVFPDIRSGAEMMMDHLIELGHTRIGFINGAARPHLSQTREDVYLEKLHSAEIPVDQVLIRHCGHLVEHAYHETLALLDLPTPPTAIWTINDLLAIGAMRAVHERGLCIPDDVAVAGFDDISLSAQIYPPLTTVHMPAREMGQRAAQFLFTRIADPGHEPMQEEMPMRLIVRQSTLSDKHDFAGRCDTVT